MSVTIVPPPRLGNLGEALTEALAWLHSPATINHEIAFLTQQIALGDRSHESAVQLADWQGRRRPSTRRRHCMTQTARPPE